jgi:hypothetical protein
MQEWVTAFQSVEFTVLILKSYGLLGTTLRSHLACRKYCCFRGNGKSEFDGKREKNRSIFHAIKVIPEIISKKGRGLMLGVEFDLTQALRKK